MPKCIDCTMHLWSYGQERVKAQLRQLRRLARNDVPQPWTRETKQILEVLEVADFSKVQGETIATASLLYQAPRGRGCM